MVARHRADIYREADDSEASNRPTPDLAKKAGKYPSRSFFSYEADLRLLAIRTHPIAQAR